MHAMKYSEKALEAINDWEKSTGAHYIGGPFFARDFGDVGMVVFEIKNWSEGIALSLIKTPPEYRGKGLASRALKELLSFADKHGVPVTGSVDPQEDEAHASGPSPLSKPQLKAWYSRHGFKNRRVDQIYRPPVANRIVDSLLENDEVDPKGFVTRVSNIDLNELRERIRAKIPDIELIRFHLIPIWQNPPFFRYELNALLAKAPVSASGFDTRHDIRGEDQRTILAIVQEWMKDRGLTLRENYFRANTARYKEVCSVTRIVFIFECELGFQIVNHDNDLQS
jgi:GNAT superfamily N-acetyltransferase